MRGKNTKWQKRDRDENKLFEKILRKEREMCEGQKVINMHKRDRNRLIEKRKMMKCTMGTSGICLGAKERHKVRMTKKERETV